ncbi:TetR/AcrR family transcriptional regulator [Streptomyces yaizuensis]|uniref:TetR/AcrR family transcriptional regulator n=1 Tax=Streptomyces yaizuensis TaxID=2989713 RepID=A0ABQ5NS54_9ACTN|nr:TetR/AcrR family transcriptional regulator [Streptomyces sp. YSPA8]GLF93206.1 TetR/AcrR family transcriptional regulator [Streptomyces sp. YSPA8]
MVEKESGYARRAGSRRERLRAELARDARLAAREIIATEGLAGLSLSGVARRVGVSPPALYRYFDGRSGLVRALYDDLTAEIVAEITGASGRQDPDDFSARLHAATRAVLDWSTANRAEFGLLMGGSFPRADGESPDLGARFTREVGAAFGRIFLELYASGGLECRADSGIRPRLRRQLRVYRDSLGLDLPLGVVLLMITCWRQIYGLVAMAVHEHLAFAFGDGDALFEEMIEDLLGTLGLTRSPRLR